MIKLLTTIVALLLAGLSMAANDIILGTPSQITWTQGNDNNWIASFGNPYIPITKGLVGAWLFPGGVSGTNLIDASGNGYSGYIYGASLPVWGAGGTNALYCNGLNGGEIPYNSAFNCTAGITLMFWANISVQWTYVSPISKPVLAPLVGVVLDWGNYIYPSGGGETYWWKNGSYGYGPMNNYGGLQSVTTNAWYHIATSNDGTNIVMYLNGLYMIKQACGFPVNSNSNAIYIATGAGVWNGSQFVGWNGLVEKALLYSRACTSNEIWTTFSAQKNAL